MALPSMVAPTYELTVPSTKQVVKYRPFLVKEEKALMIAQQSEEPQTMLDTLKSVISACTFGKLNVDTLATFDIEYIFIQLRAKSVGEISELMFSCLKCGDSKAKVKINVDLTQINVIFDERHKSDIELFNDVGIKLKYPGLSVMNKLKDVKVDNYEILFDLIVECIDYIYDTDNVYAAAEQSREELEDFINNLTQDQFAKIQEFFETMPKLEKTIEFKCPVCGFDHVQVLQGLDGFF